MKRTLAMLAAILLPFVAMSASYTNSFVRNGVTYVQRGGLTIKDYVVTNITSSGSTGLTTNDVCNIVTNEVGIGWQIISATETWYGEEPTSVATTNILSMQYVVGGDPIWDEEVFTNYWKVVWHSITQERDITGYNPYDDENAIVILAAPDAAMDDALITITRQSITVNALGLARLVDLPQLTNDVPYMISSAAQAAISTNNPAFITAVTNCPVMIAAADGTTIGEFGEYGTLGALLAALAAAITWLKTNKADASSLPYELVDVTPTAGGPYVLAACFPIKYTYGGSTVTISAADAANVLIHQASNGSYDLFDITDDTNGVPLCAVNADGTFIAADADGLTFGANEDTPDSSTQVLGFTHTAQLTDRAINAVSLTAAATLVMPAAISGHARDLVVRLAVGADGLNITWGTTDANGVAVDYETEDGNFPDLSAAGTYLVRLTETAAFATGTGGAADVPAKFLIQCQPLQTAAGGGV